MATYRAFDAASPPTTGNTDLGITLGVEFYVTSAANLTAIHWWNPTSTTDGSTRSAALFDMGAAVAAGPATTGAGPTGPGWQTITFTPFPLVVSTHYRAAVFHPNGGYSASSSYFTSLADIVVGPLTVVGAPNATDNEQGTFNSNSSITFPDSAFSSANYWVDVTVDDGTSAPGIFIEFTRVI